MTKPIGWFSKQAHLSEHYLVFLARPMPTRDRFLHPVFLSLTVIPCPDDAILVDRLIWPQ